MSIDLHILPRVSKAGIEPRYHAIQVQSKYHPIHILRAVWYLIPYSYQSFYTRQMVLYRSKLVQTHLPRLCTLQFAFIHDIRIDIVMHKLNMLLPIVLHAILNHALEGMQTLVPHPFHEPTRPAGGLTSHLKQTLIFLCKTERLLKLPFTTT